MKKTKNIKIALLLIVTLFSGILIGSKTELLKGLTINFENTKITENYKKDDNKFLKTEINEKIIDLENPEENTGEKGPELEEEQGEAGPEREEPREEAIVEDNHCQPGEIEYTTWNVQISEESINEYEEFFWKIKDELNSNNQELECDREIIIYEKDIENWDISIEEVPLNSWFNRTIILCDENAIIDAPALFHGVLCSQTLEDIDGLHYSAGVTLAPPSIDNANELFSAYVYYNHSGGLQKTEKKDYGYTVIYGR